jgi:hypothetical protein
MTAPSTRIKIEKGLNEFKFESGLPDPEDYGILALPNWNTTVFLKEKTNKGFTIGFGTPCPDDSSWLDLTIYTPRTIIVNLKEGKYSGAYSKEGKTKMPKQASYV